MVEGVATAGPPPRVYLTPGSGSGSAIPGSSLPVTGPPVVRRLPVPVSGRWGDGGR
ncbi:hypothetical protein GCM10009677_45080 [Sphaerisporangium rubeum]